MEKYAKKSLKKCAKIGLGYFGFMRNQTEYRFRLSNITRKILRTQDYYE